MDLVTVIGTMLLLVGLLVLGLYLLKRLGPKAGLTSLSRGELKLEGQLPLGPKRSVAVVRFLNKRMVLGVTEAHITLLTELDDSHAASDTPPPAKSKGGQEPKASKQPGKGFQQVLDAFDDDRGSN